MSFVFGPSFFPAFSFTKDLLLVMGLIFMALGISQMTYCLIRIRQLEEKLNIK